MKRRNPRLSTLIVGTTIVIGVMAQTLTGRSVFDMHPIWGSIVAFVAVLGGVLPSFEDRFKDER